MTCAKCGEDLVRAQTHDGEGIWVHDHEYTDLDHDAQPVREVLL